MATAIGSFFARGFQSWTNYYPILRHNPLVFSTQWMSSESWDFPVCLVGTCIIRILGIVTLILFCPWIISSVYHAWAVTLKTWLALCKILGFSTYNSPFFWYSVFQTLASLVSLKSWLLLRNSGNPPSSSGSLCVVT